MADEDVDMQVVIFRIGAEKYALPTTTAREVIPYNLPRRLPGGEEWVLGVHNVRGEIIPICDLMVALGLPEVAERNQIVVCDADDGSIGLVVEEVVAVMTLGKDDISQPESLRHPGLIGVVQRADGMIVMLDLHEVMKPETGTLVDMTAALVSDMDASSTDMKEAA